MVADSISRMNIGSVSHIDEAKKDLERKFVGWLVEGKVVRFSQRCSIVHHNSESSIVVEVKSKQHLDQELMELNESVLCKLNEPLSFRGMKC